MSKVILGLIAGIVFGALDVGLMLPMSFPDKTTALLGAFASRFAIGFVIGCVQLPSWPGWLVGSLSAGTRPTLQSGSTGTDVKRLQRALIAARGQTLAIDGDFGPASTTAVKAYQTAQGLTSDGIVGGLTWAAMQSGK